MKCGILTFSFAHNYGALLQAKSLKNYLKKNGLAINLIGFAPKCILDIYSLNPFVGNRSIRSIVSKFLRLPYKLRQYRRFTEFILELHDGKQIFSDIEKLHHVENDLDAIIVGSDQVWNDSITGYTDEYYLPKVQDHVIKISYAASYGKRKLSNCQTNNSLKYLSKFSSISIREEDGFEYLKRHIKKNIEIVLDPVFLTSRSEWAELSNRSRVSKHVTGKYMLFYSLSFDIELAKFAERIAKEHDLRIYSIHPTAMKNRVNGNQIFGVGPYEFLFLIKNAEIICTDSFHATAFSVIFNKKLAHIIKNEKESRVESLLHRLNAYKNPCPKEGMETIVDFAELEKINLNRLINQSKKYLQDALFLRNV